MIGVTVAYPPSANRLWRAVNGRNIKSAEYRAWLSLPVLGIKPGKPATGPYTMTLTAERPDRRRRDLSNLCKPVEDLLQERGFVRDDCDAQRIVLEWSDRAPGKGAAVHVVIEPVAG